MRAGESSCCSKPWVLQKYGRTATRKCRPSSDNQRSRNHRIFWKRKTKPAEQFRIQTARVKKKIQNRVSTSRRILAPADDWAPCKWHSWPVRLRQTDGMETCQTSSCRNLRKLAWQMTPGNSTYSKVGAVLDQTNHQYAEMCLGEIGSPSDSDACACQSAVHVLDHITICAAV